MAPTLTQFDQNLIGLGIYIPSSPASSTTDHPSSSTFDVYIAPASSSSTPTAALSPPVAFHTPRSQIRRSRSHLANVPQTLGTRGGFKLTEDSLPKSIYSGAGNPFLPLPSKADELIGFPGAETSEELRLPGQTKLRRRSKELDELVLPSDLDASDFLPESTFSQAQLLSPAFVARSSRYIPTRRNLGMGAGGSDPASAGYTAPGPNPSFPLEKINETPIPQTPRPAVPGDLHTPATPIPDHSASPHPTAHAPIRGDGGGGMGVVASALAHDIAPVSNPLFVASIALSVVLGVLIVGIVSCSVAYCRNAKGRRGDEESRGEGRDMAPVSPKRSSLLGVYTRAVGERGTPISISNSDTLTSFSMRNSSMVDSTPEKGFRLGSEYNHGDGSAPPSPSVPTLMLGEDGSSRVVVSFRKVPDEDSAEMQQLYSAPDWQPDHSSPLAQASQTASFPINNDPTSASAPSQVPTSSSSRHPICAVPPLDSILEESSAESHSPSPCPSSSDLTAPYPNSDSMARLNDEETTSTSYHSCSDNSSMTTHASDDAFGYTSRPTSIAEPNSAGSHACLSRPTSLANSSSRSLSLRDRTSVASSTTSFTPLDYPLYLIDQLAREEDNPEIDMSFDTLPSISLDTPQASPVSEPSLNSPLSLQSVLTSQWRNDRRKAGNGWPEGSPSPAVRPRTRFALEDDDEEPEDEADEGERWESEITGEGLSSYALFTEAFGSTPDIKRSLSLPSKPLPPSASKSVLKRALSALLTNSPAPPLALVPPGNTSNLQYGPPTPPRSSRTRCMSRPISIASRVTIIHQSDLLERSDCPPSSPTTHTPTADGVDSDRETARFSTASWDQLGSATGEPDASHLRYEGVNRPDRAGEGIGKDEDEEEEEKEEDGDEDIMAEINQARISVFPSLTDIEGSTGCGGGVGLGLGTLGAFPEPASHLPYIRVTSH